MTMKAADLPVALTLIALLAESSAAGAFGFCFSFGGGSNHRPDFYRGPPPPVGFGPGIYQAYPYSPIMAGPYARPYYMPPPVLPRHGDVPEQSAETR